MEEYYPKISIVTPSYNQGKYIEETILSILDQNYPNLEYFIIDGGSNDDTVDIIKKHEHRINFWISESDHGQSHAINKGLEMCTGEIFNWINSDDLLEKDSLFSIAKAYLQNTDIKIIAGGCTHFTNKLNENKTTLVRDLTFEGLISEQSYFQQPSQWIVLKNLKKLEIKPHFHYSFDWGMVLNLNLKNEEIKYIAVNLSYFREHDDAKTSKASLLFQYEKLEIVKEYREKTHSISKKIKLSKYIFKLSRYLEVIREISKQNHNSVVNLLILGIKSPTLFFTRFYLGYLKTLFIEK